LEVRFFGHYGQKFDASCLQYLPDVVALSVDCLFDAVNLSALSDLKNLRSLSFGVFKFDCPDFLKSLQLKNLEHLFIERTIKSNFDLSPIQYCDKLEELMLGNHTKNIDCLENLPALQKLSLWRISKKQDLKFVTRIRNLKHCRIILGGRTDISEIKHPNVEELEIGRVMGFASLKNLDAFPSLRSLIIDDQIRLGKISFTAANKKLERLHIYNCKILRSLEGMHHLASLNKIFISKTALNIDSLIRQRLPSSLKIFGFYTGKVKENKEARQRLDALGYRER
jgi:hypothetical protein